MTIASTPPATVEPAKVGKVAPGGCATISGISSALDLVDVAKAVDPYTMRAPCRWGCRTAAGEPWTTGQIRTANGQDVVRCSSCLKAQYNAPRTETGRAPRTVTTVHNGISPSQRARILQRDGRCVLCGAREHLQVGHLLSVADGLAAGLTEVELNHDGNLAAMCAECNAGVGRQSVYPWIAVPLIRAYMRLTNACADEEEGHQRRTHHGSLRNR